MDNNLLSDLIITLPQEYSFVFFHFPFPISNFSCPFILVLVREVK